MVNTCNTKQGIHHSVPHCFNVRMDLPDIRRQNLRSYLRERCKGNAADLARRINRSPSHVHDVLVGKKSFGEKFARSIEPLMGAPKMWLDQLDAKIDQQPVLATIAREVSPSYSSDETEAQLLTAFRMLTAAQQRTHLQHIQDDATHNQEVMTELLHRQQSQRS